MGLVASRYPTACAGIMQPCAFRSGVHCSVDSKVFNLCYPNPMEILLVKYKRSPLSGIALLAAVCLFAAFALSADDSQPAAAPGKLTVADLFRLGAVSDPQVSPEGQWIAYVVSRKNLEKDKSQSQVWVIPAGGGDPVAMTAEGESSSHPRWSPDGKYLAFLSARDEGQTQVWRLSRQGGEAVQLTDTAQSVGDFEWSPDSARLALVLQDPTPQELAKKKEGASYKEKTPPPWVIDREQFKEDYVGYLDRRRTHVYVLEIASGTLAQLTSGDYDDDEPVWSPDGSRIAFTSNRSADPDNNYNTDIWVVSSAAGSAASPVASPVPAELVKVSDSEGPDASPAWSPDGKWIVHTSATDVAASVYATAHLAVSSAAGGNSRVLTTELDRMIFHPEFSPDGKSIWFLLEDSGEQNLARISPKGGKIERLITGDSVVADFSFGENSEVAALVSRPQLPAEVFSFNRGKLEQRTFTNKSVLDGLQLGTVEEVHFNSKDGTPIEGFVIKPPGFVEGQRYPAILDIHGGPQSQYDYSFQFEAQLFAANGYVVVHPNPRGSTGYGQAFCLGIWQDWGGPDFDDVMAAVDYAIAQGWADPDRLGVTGWSYGGILTNHVITKTDRFKAAITGAGSTLYVASYGHDMYQRWWEQELGFPWEPAAREKYERISPYNKVKNIKTPTLIMGGEIDWNVPIINSEQLYLALRTLGVETELVVYPGEYHGIDKPSHAKDLYERYLAWFGKHL